MGTATITGERTGSALAARTLVYQVQALDTDPACSARFVVDQCYTADFGNEEEARRYIPGGTSRIHYVFQPYPIYARSGSGCYLTDVEGVSRLDCLNNMTSLIHGHGNPAVKQAMFDVVRFWLDKGVDGFRLDVAHMFVKAIDLPDNPRKFGLRGYDLTRFLEQIARQLAPFRGQPKIRKAQAVPICRYFDRHRFC